MEIIINELRNKRKDKDGNTIWDFGEASQYIYEPDVNPTKMTRDFDDSAGRQCFSIVTQGKYHISFYLEPNENPFNL